MKKVKLSIVALILNSTFLILNSPSAKAQVKVYSGGKASIGSTTTTPTYIIDVITGDVNVNTSTNGYRINGNYVLQQKNISSCIFVGSLAGNCAN